jgi:prepilin-type N-terminal cleavage/methylation domain-containing protein
MFIPVRPWSRHAFGHRGFTLIELTVALALATILMGLVIVRFSWGSPRQQAIADARKLGNLIRTFREQAQSEEREYALRIESSSNHYEVLPVSDRTPEALSKAKAIREGKLSDRMQMKVMAEGSRELSMPVVLYFNRHGVLPETAIELSCGPDLKITLRPNPLLNEVVYEEQ